MRTLKLVVLVLTVLFLATPVPQADAKTIKFKSVVKPEKWSRTIRGTLTFPKGKGPFPVVIFLHPCGGWKKPPRAAAEEAEEEKGTRDLKTP